MNFVPGAVGDFEVCTVESKTSVQGRNDSSLHLLEGFFDQVKMLCRERGGICSPENNLLIVLKEKTLCMGELVSQISPHLKIRREILPVGTRECLRFIHGDVRMKVRKLQHELPTALNHQCVESVAALFSDVSSETSFSGSETRSFCKADGSSLRHDEHLT